MNCRDFIYWLQGAFEIGHASILIDDFNYKVILEHIKLAKKTKDDFFEHVCFIEGVLSLWDHEEGQDVILHEEMINSQISSYLDSLFTKITNSEKTLEDYVHQGIRIIAHQNYDSIEEDMWSQPGSASHPIHDWRRKNSDMQPMSEKAKKELIRRINDEVCWADLNKPNGAEVAFASSGSLRTDHTEEKSGLDLVQTELRKSNSVESIYNNPQGAGIMSCGLEPRKDRWNVPADTSHPIHDTTIPIDVHVPSMSEEAKKEWIRRIYGDDVKSELRKSNFGYEIPNDDHHSVSGSLSECRYDEEEQGYTKINPFDNTFDSWEDSRLKIDQNQVEGLRIELEKAEKAQEEKEKVKAFNDWENAKTTSFNDPTRFC